MITVGKAECAQSNSDQENRLKKEELFELGEEDFIYKSQWGLRFGYRRFFIMIQEGKILQQRLSFWEIS